MHRRHAGFSLMELLVVMAVVAILALLALPSFRDKFIRDNIVEAVPLVDVAKKAVAASWPLTNTLPADNLSAGLPPPDKMVSNVVQSVTVEVGAIHVMFGNRASGAILGKVLTFRPAVVAGEPLVPVAWVCGRAKVPDKMTAMGTDKTDIPTSALPVNCR